jgi:hypothetical protein
MALQPQETRDGPPWRGIAREPLASLDTVAELEPSLHRKWLCFVNFDQSPDSLPVIPSVSLLGREGSERLTSTSTTTGAGTCSPGAPCLQSFQLVQRSQHRSGKRGFMPLEVFEWLCKHFQDPRDFERKIIELSPRARELLLGIFKIFAFVR